MTHKIVSFVHNDLNQKIGDLQKKWFDRLEIPLEFHYFNGTHHHAIDYYLENTDWDVITLFDVDCIPLNKKCVDDVLNIVNDNTIYGNAQVSNAYPYAAPSFLSFTRKLYETSKIKTFHGGYYLNKNNVRVEADCGEIFVKDNLKRGKKQILSYPYKAENYKWKFKGDDEYPAFKYGNGSFFDNETFHYFEIRLVDNHQKFISFVENLLKNEN